MSKEPDPRVASKEMIITRFKSAQQKRKLREKDRMVDKASQLLKPPPKAYSNKAKKEKSPKSPIKNKEKGSKTTSSKIIDLDETKEYYPEKLKRSPGEKKAFLKPKPEYKMVARTNKRKFNTPKRGVKSPLPSSHMVRPDGYEPSPAKIKCQSPVYSELSMEEVIRIVEDTQSLDDDDLMEILTCPSPVWWEEPPDGDYFEEAICSRSPGEDSPNSPIKERCLQTSRILMKENNSEMHSINTDTLKSNKKDEKFMKKSKKLENVLGNIKNKSITNKDFNLNTNQGVNSDECVVKEDIPIHSDREEMDTNENTTEKVSPAAKKSLKREKDENNIETGSELNDRNLIPIETMKTETHRKVKRISESTEEDLDFPDEGMLLDLENMDIPTENMQLNRESESSDDVIFINDDEASKVTDVDLLDDGDDKSTIRNTEDDSLDTKYINPTVQSQRVLDSHSKAVKKELLKDDEDSNSSQNILEHAKNSDTNIVVHDINIQLGNESEEVITNKVELLDEKPNIIPIDVPQNLPPLIKRPKFALNSANSPNMSKNISEDPTEVSSDILDTISDTNIKFIMDDDDDIDYISDTDGKTEIEKDVKTEMTDSQEGKNSSDSFEAADSKIQLNDMKETNMLEDAKSSKDSYITVYKIVPNEEKIKRSKFKNIPEYSNHVQNLNQAESVKQEINDDYVSQECKGQLNSFFKKCKNANRKKCKTDLSNETVDMNNVKNEEICESCEPKKSITVAQEDNVKYCLKCSAIFDTDDCSFCVQTQKDDSNSNFACDICDFEADDRMALKSHLAKHVSDDTKSFPLVNHVRDIH